MYVFGWVLFVLCGWLVFLFCSVLCVLLSFVPWPFYDPPRAFWGEAIDFSSFDVVSSWVCNAYVSVDLISAFRSWIRSLPGCFDSRLVFVLLCPMCF